MRFLLLLFGSILFASTTYAEEKANIQIGLSIETVEITSSFNGTDVVIFGSIENGDRELLEQGRYDVVVVLAGPNEEVIVRRKAKTFGIWVNRDSVRFGDVPSSYSVATTRPLNEIAGASDVRILQIGLNNLNVITDESRGAVEDAEQFRKSLARLKVQKDLFLERIGGVTFLSPTLFKAEIAVPASVPIGRHTARAFLFKDGKFENAKHTEMRVKKIGFEQFTYDLAHENGLLYGIIAVLIAMATGWLASVVFRKD